MAFNSRSRKLSQQVILPRIEGQDSSLTLPGNVPGRFVLVEWLVLHERLPLRAKQTLLPDSKANAYAPPQIRPSMFQDLCPARRG